MIAVLAVLLAAPARPSIVVILADDLGYADVGFHGCKDIPTPHLDKLAADGVRCTNGYVSHPFCSPTRAALLTGKYQHRFGHENNPAWLPADATVGLPLAEKTIADHLTAAGYATGCVGKWHLGAHPTFHPNRRGFAEYFGLLGGGHQYFDHNRFRTDPKRAAQEYFIPLVRNGTPVEETDYLTDALGREAAAFARRHRGRPFFLYLAFNAPHAPLQAPPAYLDRVKHIPDQRRRTYAAMMVGVDDAVGKLSAELSDNTLVVFMSDNGGPVGVNASRNDPFRGAKGQVYEGGIRVPFVVRWPARLTPGTCDAPVTCRDILPTALAAAGVAPPAGPDGTDLLPHLAGSPLPDRPLVWRMNGDKPWAVRRGSVKLVRPAAGPAELYDLAADPAEGTDLAASRPADVARLAADFAAWGGIARPPLWSNPAPAKK